MFRKILIGVDDSEQARDAVAFTQGIGDETGAELVVAAVLPQDPLTGGPEGSQLTGVAARAEGS